MGPPLSGSAAAGPAEGALSAGAGQDSFSDEELTALALAADPDQPVDDGAVPIDLYPPGTYGLLPCWYMPPVTARGGRRWRVPVVFLLVAAFLLIDAFGLCITYGQLVAA